MDSPKKMRRVTYTANLNNKIGPKQSNVIEKQVKLAIQANFADFQMFFE